MSRVILMGCAALPGLVQCRLGILLRSLKLALSLDRVASAESWRTSMILSCGCNLTSGALTDLELGLVALYRILSLVCQDLGQLAQYS